MSLEQARDKTAESRTYLVASNRKPFAVERENSRLDAGQFGRKFDEVDAAKETTAALGLIFPGDAEQIAGLYVPKAGFFQLALDGFGHFFRIFHLCKSRDDNLVFLRSRNDTFVVLCLLYGYMHVYPPLWLHCGG